MTAQRALPIVQHVAALSRRTSLLALGGAALARAVHGLSPAEAKKKRKKGRKRNRKRAQECPECPECSECPEEEPPVDQCAPQEAPCREFAEQFCPLFHPPGPPSLPCVVATYLCCRSLGQCDAEAFFVCLAGQFPEV
jgi:hypothetical protein